MYWNNSISIINCINFFPYAIFASSFYCPHCILGLSPKFYISPSNLWCQTSSSGRHKARIFLLLKKNMHRSWVLSSNIEDLCQNIFFQKQSFVMWLSTFFSLSKGSPQPSGMTFWCFIFFPFSDHTMVTWHGSDPFARGVPFDQRTFCFLTLLHHLRFSKLPPKACQGHDRDLLDENISGCFVLAWGRGTWMGDMVCFYAQYMKHFKFRNHYC